MCNRKYFKSIWFKNFNKQSKQAIVNERCGFVNKVLCRLKLSFSNCIKRLAVQCVHDQLKPVGLYNKGVEKKNRLPFYFISIVLFYFCAPALSMADSEYYSTNGMLAPAFTPSNFTYPAFSEDNGVYKVSVQPASSSAVLRAIDKNSGKSIPVSPCPHSTLPAERLAASCFLVYSTKFQRINFTYHDTGYSGGAAVLFSDFFPDDINFYAPFEWAKLAYKRQFSQTYDVAFAGFKADLGMVSFTVRNSVLAVKAVDSLLSFANAKAPTAILKNGKYIRTPAKLLTRIEVANVLDASAKGADGAIGALAQNTGIIDNATTLIDAGVAMAQIGINPKAAYQTIASDFAQAGVYAYGVYNLNSQDLLINAYLIVNDLLYKQINTSLFSTSAGPLPDAELRSMIQKIVALHNNNCGSWTPTWTGLCGWAHYDENYVVSLYNESWANMKRWIANRKKMGNPYVDVDDDGITNIEEINLGADPNVSNPPKHINHKPVAVIANITSAVLNAPVTLNGTSSYDPDGDSITSHQWSLIKPAGSSAFLSSITGNTTSFTPDMAGSFSIKLTVSDGNLTNSSITSVSVNGTYPNVETVYENDKKHVYISNLTVGKCTLKQIGSFTVPAGEKWTNYKMGGSKGDVILLVKKNNPPTLRNGNTCLNGYAQAFNASGQYEWYDASHIYNYTPDLFEGTTLYLAAFSYAGISNYSINSYVSVTTDIDGDGVPDFKEDPPCRNNRYETFDSDHDGICNNQDKFDNDPAASIDSDGDGYPDKWNSGKSSVDSITGLVLDVFINNSAEWSDADGDGVGDNADKFDSDPAASKDTDGDGFPDSWNPGKTAANSTTGLVKDKFSIDPAASLDTDNDGAPDAWNAGKSATDSTSVPKLALDAFPNDPSASVDSDWDGYPNVWNAGKSAANSTSVPVLALDVFPSDPLEWKDSDGDGVGDNADVAPNDPLRWGNVVPVLSLIANKTVLFGLSATVTIGATDQDGDVLTYQLLSAPVFVTLVGQQLTIAPQLADAGTYAITVKVLDSFGGIDSQVVKINVPVQSNQPPVPLASAINTSTGVVSTNQINPNDPNTSDTHTYAVTTQPIPGNTATVDKNTGLATYTPATGFTGSDSFVVTVTDQGGLSGSVTINVTVSAPLDIIAPTITLLGLTPLNLIIGDVFVDPGATALDDMDGDITANIQVTGTVDTAIMGNYTLTYTVTDQSGNTASATRTVIVIPAAAPTALLVPDKANLEMVENEFLKIMLSGGAVVDVIDAADIKASTIDLTAYDTIACFTYGAESTVAAIDQIVVDVLMNAVSSGTTFVSNQNACGAKVMSLAGYTAAKVASGWYPSLPDSTFLTAVDPADLLFTGVSPFTGDPQSQTVNYWTSGDHEALMFRVDNTKSYTGRYAKSGQPLIAPDRYLASGFGTGFSVGQVSNLWYPEWIRGSGRIVELTALNWTFDQATKSGGYIGIAGRQILQNIAVGVSRPIIDTVAPVVLAPANISIEVNSNLGPSINDSLITDFLAGASVTDDIDTALNIVHDAPAVFSLGVTTVTFQATDTAGNTGMAQATVTVTSTDNDGDGLPNIFEVSVGLDPNNSADAAGDLDGDGLTNIEEYQQGTNISIDDVMPVLSIPANITVNSTGPLTPVDLGLATAIDVKDGNLAPTVDNAGPFVPGRHIATWSVSDQAGNTVTEQQVIDVIPMVSFAPSQTIDEGTTATVNILLNGNAVNYPVKIPYIVGGTAEAPADFGVPSGFVEIESGVQASITINTVEDTIWEGLETVVLTIGEPINAVAGSVTDHTVSLKEENIAPSLNLLITQAGQPVTTIAANGGDVQLFAEVMDPNPDDIHTYDWSGVNNNLLPVEGYTNSTFTFDPASLSEGVYNLSLVVSDNGEPALNGKTDTVIRVVASAPALSSTIDTDGDGAMDLTEGMGDADMDRIPDYLDAVSDVNLLPASTATTVLQADMGLSLRLGKTAFASGNAYAQISIENVANNGGIAGGLAINANDSNYDYPAGIFDFEVTGLEKGSIARIVLPLTAAIPPDAVYRKYLANSGWFNFVENSDNAISSAIGQPGVCPAPGDSTYVPGLVEGANCIQLAIQDGGPNDTDGRANGIVADPGGVAVPANINNSGSNSGSDSNSSGSGGSGSMSIPGLLLLLMWAAGIHYRNQIRHRM